MAKQKQFKKMLGEKIKTLRDIHGMTQMDLAHKLGYESSGMVSQIENGTKGMDQEKIFKLSQIFNVSMIDLLSNKRYSRDDFKMIIKLQEWLDLPSDKRPKHFESVRLLLENS